MRYYLEDPCVYESKVNVYYGKMSICVQVSRKINLTTGVDVRRVRRGQRIHIESSLRNMYDKLCYVYRQLKTTARLHLSKHQAYCRVWNHLQLKKCYNHFVMKNPTKWDRHTNLIHLKFHLSGSWTLNFMRSGRLNIRLQNN